MDAVYRRDSWVRNVIIWRIGWVSGLKTQKRGWIRNLGTLLYYVKSPEAADGFNNEYLTYPESAWCHGATAIRRQARDALLRTHGTAIRVM